MDYKLQLMGVTIRGSDCGKNWKFNAGRMKRKSVVSNSIWLIKVQAADT